jgi:protein O-GlcNAc transferase
MQPPGDYAFDYWMLARNMGHKHFMVRNDTVTTYRPGEWHNVRVICSSPRTWFH